MLASAATAATAMSVFIVSGAWLDDVHGVSTGGLGLVAAGFGALELMSSGSVALFADRVGARRSVAAGLLVLGFGLALMAGSGLSEITAPEGVEFLDDLEETIIATVVVPTEVEEPEEIEEETELVGEDGEPIEAAEGEEGEEGEGAEAPPRKPKARSPEPLPPRGGGRQGGLADRRAGQPRRPLRAHAPQRRLRGGRAGGRALGPAARRRRGTPASSPTAAPARAGRAWRCCCRRPT